MLSRKPFLATTQVPRNANTVTKIAVGMVELFPSLLLNLASGPQIAVMKTATHMAAIATDAHISRRGAAVEASRVYLDRNPRRRTTRPETISAEPGSI